MAISAYFGHPEIPRPNFHVPVLATASPGIDLVKSLAFRVSLQQFLTKKMKKMAKKWPKMTKKWPLFGNFSIFFKKILVLMPRKLLCIFWPFVPTYSQSSSHLETISGIKFFFVFFLYFLIIFGFGFPSCIKLMPYQP